MRKVLVVDDEFLVRVGIKSFLNWEENGYTIIAEAADGKQALEIMERELPDVVLTDLKMDGMDGFELIQVSRKRFPTVQFVALSSFEDGENVKRAMKLGAADYIFKLTSKPEELLRILNELPYEQPENEAEKLLRKNRSAIKQRLIRMAAQKSYPYRAELQEEFRQMELKTEFQKPYCVLLSRFSREIHEKDSAVLRYAMENMTQEVFEGGLCTETYPYTANSILVIVQQTGSTQPVEQIRRAFSRLYEYAARYLGLHLEGCLSTVHTGMEQFSDALTECERTLDRHLPHAEGELQQYSGETRAEIVAVKRYVQNNLTAELTVKDAAELCSMSESYFSHLFKKETGISFVDYVNTQRVCRAEELLRTSDKRISEIAQAVGVENSNYFSVMFRKMRGISPQEYRNQKKSRI